MWKRRTGLRAAVAGLASVALSASVIVSVAGPVQATELPDGISTRLPGLGEAVSIQSIDLSAGARRIGLASDSIFIQSTRTGTANIRMLAPAPYARIVPVTGDPYLVSAGELAQNFTALLGPNPTLGISYGAGERQRSLTFTSGVSAPVYDPVGQSVTFQALGMMQPVSDVRAVVTFIATDPRSRPTLAQATRVPEILSRVGAFDPATSPRRRQVRTTAADTNATYTYDSSSLGSQTSPSPILSPTQAVYSGTTSVTTSTSLTRPKCVSYDPNSTSSGGNAAVVSNLVTESTSTQVSESVNAGTSASVKAGGLKTSLSASYAGTTTQDAASVYAVATVATAGLVTNLAPSLTYSTANITSVATALPLLAACGDQVAVQYTSGGVYKSVLQMQTASQSEAQDLKASLSVSYSSPGSSSSAGGTFSGAVASSSSVTSVNVTELCLGISSCGAVTGYQPITSSDPTTALNAFDSNFNAMTTGMPCSATSTSGCGVVSLTYAPIENLIADSAAAGYVSQASQGVYWMLTNTQAWSNQYQSLATAYTNAASQPDGTYTMSATDLKTQGTSYGNTAKTLLNWAATTCNKTNLNSNACSGYMIACANAIAANQAGTTAASCLPSSINFGTGVTIVDPSTLAAPQLVAPSQTCNDAYPNHKSSDNKQVTLYLGGIQAVSYSAWCFWDNNAVTTYIPVTATSQTSLGKTSYSWAQFDPATGTLYAVMGPYPSTIQAAVKPTCPASGCAPLGYVQLNNGSSGTSTSTVQLPPNLGFASTTSVQGSGNATITTPTYSGKVQPVSNTFVVSQIATGGSSLIEDSGSVYQGSGLSLIVPVSTKYPFKPTGTAPSVVPAGATACALSSSGSTSSNADASNNVSNQQLSLVGYVQNQGPGACTAQLSEWNYKNPGKAAWYDSNWYVNSEWGPLFPTFICGTRDSSSGDLQYKIGADYSGSGGNSVSTQWFAVSGGSKADMAIYITFDNVNAPLAPDNVWHYVGGTCPSNATPLKGTK